MTRRSLLPRTCRDYPARRPPAARPPSSATPDTPLFLQPLHSLGEIPRPRTGTTCGIALRRPSSSQATAAEPPAARAGAAPAPGTSSGPALRTEITFSAPLLGAPAASRVGALEKGESCRGLRGLSAWKGAAPLGKSRPVHPRSSGRPGRGRQSWLLDRNPGGPSLPSPAGLCFVIPSPLTRAHGCAPDLWGQAALPRR